MKEEYIREGVRWHRMMCIREYWVEEAKTEFWIEEVRILDMVSMV